MLLADSNNEELKAFYLSLNILLKKRNMGLLPDIPIVWSDKMRKRWGVCYAAKNKDRTLAPLYIKLNHIIFKRMRPDIAKHHIEATIRHEAGHAWTAEHCNRMDHSTCWAHVARILGDTGSKNVNFSIPQIKQAVVSCAYIPTTIDTLDNRQIHALRTSLAHVCRTLDLDPDEKTFDANVAPRFHTLVRKPSSRQKQDYSKDKPRMGWGAILLKLLWAAKKNPEVTKAVVEVATDIVTDLIDPPEKSVPLTYKDVEHQRAQAEAAARPFPGTVYGPHLAPQLAKPPRPAKKAPKK